MQLCFANIKSSWWFCKAEFDSKFWWEIVNFKFTGIVVIILSESVPISAVSVSDTLLVVHVHVMM